MTSTTDAPSVRSHRRPPRAARQLGYGIAGAVNLVLLWVVNLSPGWEVVPFLTEDFRRVVGYVNASLVVGLLVNLAYVLTDPVWVRRLGDAITAGFALVVLLQVVTVFPFDLGLAWSGWDTLLRTVLAVACVGTAIGVLANLAQVLRALVDGPREPTAA